MPQKYKVFFNHNKVYFVKSYFAVPAAFSSIKNPNNEQLTAIVAKYFESDTHDCLYLICDDLQATWKAFKSIFKIKKAAGGLVVNNKNEFLFIKRKGLYDLPKGHIEKDEKTKNAAIREVSEECGISNLLIDEKLCKTYHTYALKGDKILKPSTWYLMQYQGTEKPKPQTKEGITEAFWVPVEELGNYCKQAFPSIICVIKKAIGSDFCASTVRD